MTPSELHQFIHKTAKQLGFAKIGITPANSDPILEQRLSLWIEKKFHASMHWMENRSLERSNILKYYPNAKSIISLGMNYFTGLASKEHNVGKLSNYAWGDDYHQIIKPRLYKLLSEIKLVHKKIDGIACVDTSPIMEKYWAQKAGLGWIGKHTNLITRDFGSWLFLGEIIIDAEIKYDSQFYDDLCGTCTACLDACPTNAFPEPYILDSSKCISYLTIEHRNNLPIEMQDKLSGWIYGCDICQEVCPWNIKFSQISNENYFQPRSNLNNRNINDWNQMTEDQYRELFKGSAVKRTKFSGLKRNIIHNIQ